MQSKIYIVKEQWGEYEDYGVRALKAFKKEEDAYAYMKELDNKEDEKKDRAVKCYECEIKGVNRNCPFYVPSYTYDEECENHNSYYDPSYYFIEEIDLEE